MAVPPPPPGFQIVPSSQGGLGRPIIRHNPQPAPRNPDQTALDRQQVTNAGLDADIKRLTLAGQRRDATEAAAKAGKAGEQTATATENLLRVIQRMDRVAKDANDNGGWGETGMSGAAMRSLPTLLGGKGTAGYDIQRDLDLVGSNAAIESLMTMRRESPTGAGVGNVALGEMQLMKDKYGIFDPDQSHGAFMKNLGEGKREFLRMLSRINPKAAQQYLAQSPDGIWVTKDGKWHIGKPNLGQPQSQQRPARQPGLPQGVTVRPLD